MPSPEPEHILWGDLETTGLDVNHCQVLEAGFVITDSNFDVVTSRSFLTHPTGWQTTNWAMAFNQINTWKECDQFAFAMHQKSGLYDDWNTACQESKLLSYAQVDEHVSFAMKEISDEPRTWQLAGSGIGPFDLPIIRRVFPQVASLLHYRPLDLSPMKSLLSRLELMQDIEAMPNPDDKVHRGLTDVFDNIAEITAIANTLGAWHWTYNNH